MRVTKVEEINESTTTVTVTIGSTVTNTTTDFDNKSTTINIPLSNKDNRFVAKIDAPTEDDVTMYSHGIDPQKVEFILEKKKEIEARINNGGEAVTLEEFKEIIIPWNRIHRTTEFILNKPKEKVKKVREPKEPKAPRAPRAAKEPKEKKLTKKEVEKLLNSAIIKMATGQTLTEQEQQVFDEHANVKIM